MKNVTAMSPFVRAILVTLVLALFVFPEIASAKITIKAAQGNSETHPVGIGLINFAKRVQELTGGEVEVKLFHSAALGGDREIIEATQLGQIEIGTSTMGVMANFAPELDIISLPFLFNGYDHIQKVLTGPELKPVFEAALKKVGLVSLGSSTGGIRQAYSKKPLRSIEDFKGVKFRNHGSADDHIYV